MYKLVQQELDPAKQLKLCEEARRLIHERTLELVRESQSGTEQKELEEAMRMLWVLEQKIRHPDIQ